MSKQRSVKLVHLDFVLKVYKTKHKLYAVLLIMCIFLLSCCMGQIVQSKDSTMANENRTNR